MNYSLIIFSILTLILLYYLYNTINKNIELFKNSEFEFNIDSFNQEFELLKETKKENIDEIYEGDVDTRFYRIPFKSNSLLIKDVTDEGVLKNFRYTENTNSFSDEISYNSIVKILNEILKLKEYNLDTNINQYTENNKYDIYKLIFQLLIDQINYNFLKLDLEIKEYKFDKRKFIYHSHNIIYNDIKNNKTDDNRILIFTIFIYRENKKNFYSLQIECEYNIVFKKIFFEKIDILGILEQDKISFDKYQNYEKKNCSMDNDEKSGLCFPNINPENKSLDEYEKSFKENKLKNYFNKKKTEEEEEKEYIKYKCFLKDGFNESICKSYSYDKQTYGVWDKPCNVNSECPFYKKNLNYENDRGGCINGYCEMPSNIERVGYKYYRKKKLPFCYNCNIKNCKGEDCYTCCEKQKDRQLYPNLKSPDYIFSNDNRN